MDTKLDLSSQDVARIEASKIIAVDLETGGLNPNRDAIYLIQLCDQNEVIDLIKNDDWQMAKNLQRVFNDPEIIKVFHFAIMDCGAILKHFGFIPQSIFCTKITSKIARTYSSTHSLASLVEEFMGVTLDKRQQLSFWGNEVLSTSQLDYAANDVKHLLGIKEKLETILLQRGTLPTGISFYDLNKHCQAMIPALVHLWINGWDFGMEEQSNVLGR